MFFKEFLENNSFPCMDCGSVQCALCSKTLGEWAFKEFEKLRNVSANVRNARKHEYYLLKEITFACLGENEMAKRLREAV